MTTTKRKAPIRPVRVASKDVTKHATALEIRPVKGTGSNNEGFCDMDEACVSRHGNKTVRMVTHKAYICGHPAASLCSICAGKWKRMWIAALEK